jgi:hypothetical protein
MEEGKGKTALISANAIRGLIPDLEAMPPKPDPVGDAKALLWEVTQRAQELLRTEAIRIQKMTAVKEAFAIPGGLFFRVVEAAKVNPNEDDYKAASRVFEGPGGRCTTIPVRSILPPAGNRCASLSR